MTERIACASATVLFSKETFTKLIKKGSPKGEIFNTARCAAILAAKKTSEIIPLCHNIPLSNVEVDLKFDEKKFVLEIFAKVSSKFSTGVEMEALTACSVASLTVYDMCKSVDKKIVIQNLKLTYKSGGKSGVFKID